MSYDILIVGPLREMLAKVAHFIPTLVVSVVILIFGYVIAKMLSRMLHHLLRIVDFDKLTDKLGLGHFLSKGGIKHKPSDLLSSLVYYVLMVMTLIITFKALGLTMASMLLEGVLSYIPSVITGVLVLMLGFLIAAVISSLVYVIACNLDIPHPDILGRLSKYAIAIYVTVIFLREIGFGHLFIGTNYTIFFAGVIFALALAFGLGGKDIAARYLDVFKRK